MKKLLQMIVRWFEMTFKFNVKGLTPKDAQKENESAAKQGLTSIIPQALFADKSLSHEVSTSSYWTYSGIVYAPYKAFSKIWFNGNYRWLTPVNKAWTPQWIQLKLPKAFEISAYKLFVGYSASDQTELDRNPKHITLEGSNDGSSWTVLDEQTNLKQPEAIGEEHLFMLTRKVTYQYYRINILETHGGENSTKGVHIWEIDFLN